MPLRLRIINIFLASLVFVYLGHTFKLPNLNLYVQRLSKDYLMNKNPETQLRMEPLFEKVKHFCEKALTLPPASFRRDTGSDSLV